MKSNITAVIPARLKSSRFENKLLAEIEGKKIIEHTILSILKARNKFKYIVLISPDDELIEIAKWYGISYIKTEEKVPYGTARLKSVFKEFKSKWYMTIPADEFKIDVERAVSSFKLKFLKEEDYIYTFYSDFIRKSRLLSHKSCKIVTDVNNFVLYFSRNVIPLNKDGSVLDISKYKKHVGMFVFSRKKIKNMEWEDSEFSEGLEQNNFLFSDNKIEAIKIFHKYYGIDTEEDLEEIKNEIFHGYN